MKVYKDEYGTVEKCINCGEVFIFVGMDECEPLEVYECDCKNKRYKGINGYEG